MFSKSLNKMTPAFDTEDYTYEQLKDWFFLIVRTIYYLKEP